MARYRFTVDEFKQENLWHWTLYDQADVYNHNKIIPIKEYKFIIDSDLSFTEYLNEYNKNLETVQDECLKLNYEHEENEIYNSILCEFIDK